MPPKAAASGSNSCFKCKSGLNRSDVKVKCEFCRKYFHIDCAIGMTPGLTRPVAEAMANCDAGIIFKCETCKSGSSPNLSDIVGKLNEMENRMEQLPVQVSAEISVHLEEISNKLNSCINNVVQLEEKTNTKFKQLELENNSLRRQLNRADIIISGLPSKLKADELINLVLNICKHYAIEISVTEINTCCWIHKKKDVLVKFNNISKRDLIMRKYHENHNLQLNQIYQQRETADDGEVNNEENDGQGETAGAVRSNGSRDNARDIEARVFLNDNLTAPAAKVKYLGRKLLREKKIKKFKLLDWDEPKAKITFNNGSEKLCTLDELIAL